MFNEKEIERATKHINDEMDKSAEEFYNTKKDKKKTMAYHYKSSFLLYYILPSFPFKTYSTFIASLYFHFNINL